VPRTEEWRKRTVIERSCGGTMWVAMETRTITGDRVAVRIKCRARDGGVVPAIEGAAAPAPAGWRCGVASRRGMSLASPRYKWAYRVIVQRGALPNARASAPPPDMNKRVKRRKRTSPNADERSPAKASYVKRNLCRGACLFAARRVHARRKCSRTMSRKVACQYTANATKNNENVAETVRAVRHQAFAPPLQVGGSAEKRVRGTYHKRQSTRPNKGQDIEKRATGRKTAKMKM
jgi:hypothetical protein